MMETDLFRDYAFLELRIVGTLANVLVTTPVNKNCRWGNVVLFGAFVQFYVFAVKRGYGTVCRT